jgi:hypothetical protein
LNFALFHHGTNATAILWNLGILKHYRTDDLWLLLRQQCLSAQLMMGTLMQPPEEGRLFP